MAKEDVYAKHVADVRRLMGKRSVETADAVIDQFITSMRGKVPENSKQAEALKTRYAVNARSLAGKIRRDIERTNEDAARDSVQRMQWLHKKMDGERHPLLDDRRVVMKTIERVQKSQASRKDFNAFLQDFAAKAAETVLRSGAEQKRSGRDIHTDAEENLRAMAWRVARASQYEASHAYNATQGELIRLLDDDDHEIYKRWTELVEDGTGKPLDDKVAVDSLILHGQVVRGDRLFVMPNDPRTPHGLIGSSWAHPPNRPHDRAVITPWRPSWDIPGWKVVSGRKVPVLR